MGMISSSAFFLYLTGPLALFALPFPGDVDDSVLNTGMVVQDRRLQAHLGGERVGIEDAYNLLQSRSLDDFFGLNFVHLSSRPQLFIS